MRQHPLALTRKDLISMLFIDNKYTNWYNSIIRSARNRILEGYSENHHIIPKSLGGSNDKSNIVALTAREHFICHLLLTKMTTGLAKSKMSKAAFMLTTSSTNQERYKITNRRYEQLKLEFSISHQGKVSNKKGIKITDPEKLANIKAAAQRRSLRYKSGELDNSKVGKYTRTDEHRQLLRDQVKNKPTFNTSGWIPSTEVRKKISESNKGKPKRPTN